MISDKDKAIFRLMRNNARINLTDISKSTGIPVSTIYDRVKANEKLFVKKHTTLIDFSKLGYNAKALIALKVSYEQREMLMKFLLEHGNVNSLYRINYGLDFLVEVIFPDISHVESFIEQIEHSFDIKQRHIFNVLEDIKREVFWK